MAINSIFAFFQSFVPGNRLIDGGDLKNLVNFQFSTSASITALAGGGLGPSTPVANQAINWVGVVANNNDSIALPPAIPGLSVDIINDGASTLTVWGNGANQNNGGVADKIVAHGGLSSAAATSQNQGTTVMATYTCFTTGLWKQFLSA